MEQAPQQALRLCRQKELNEAIIYVLEFEVVKKASEQLRWAVTQPKEQYEEPLPKIYHQQTLERLAKMF